MNKKGAITIVEVILIIVGIVVVANLMGWDTSSILGEKKAATGGTTTGTVTGEVKCSDSSITGRMGNSEVAFSPATAVTGVGYRLYVDGDSPKDYTEAATDTFGPNQVIDAYISLNETLDTAKGAGATGSDYYAIKVPQIKVGCTKFNIASKDSKLERNSTLTISVFNYDSGNLNAIGSENMTIGAGDSVSNKLEIRTQSQRAFSPFGNIVATLHGNATLYEKIEISGDGWTKADCPSLKVDTLAQNDASRFCYKHAGLKSADGSQLITGNLNVKAYSGQDPVASDASSEITLRIYDEDYFVNTVTNAVEFGVEDDQQTEVGFVRQSAIIGTD